MDAIRRGAMVKAMRVGAGALAGLSSIGQTQANLNSIGLDQAAPSPAMPYPSDTIGYADKTGAAKYDPVHEARWLASKPLRQKMDELHGHTGWQLSRFHYAVNENTYLNSLRSTQPWWRASVAMDRRKAQVSAIETLQEQIDKLMRSPLDALESTFRDAVNGFLAEMSKP